MKKMFSSSLLAFLLKLSDPTEQLVLLFLQNISRGAALVTLFSWAMWAQWNQNQMCSLQDVIYQWWSRSIATKPAVFSLEHNQFLSLLVEKKNDSIP